MPKRILIFTLLFLTVSFFGAQTNFAQLNSPIPPPLGPASYRSDQKQIGVGLMTSMVKTKVEEILTETNNNIKAQGKNIRLELTSISVSVPSRAATQFSDRPNQWFVRLPLGVKIKVVIPYVSDRTIYLPVDINSSCENWHTGRGTLQIIAKPGPASIEGGNILEEIVGIKDYVDNQIKSRLPRLGFVNASGSNPPQCSTIGYSPGAPPDYRFGFIAYDAPPRIRPIIGTIALPTVEVTFQKLKRLSARGRNGAILYNQAENIVLETYANHDFRQSSVLTMREGDEISLNLTPSKASAGAEMLIVLANIKQQTDNGIPDSNFATTMQSANFSPGTHTLQITKHYVIPPSGQNRKPIHIRVPAYELTYTVRSSNGGILISQ